MIISGLLSIVVGAIWAVWPQLLRGWLVRKSGSTIMWAVLAVGLAPYAAWASKWGVNGWVSAGVAFMVLGLILHRLISSMAERVPLPIFRFFGFLTFASGCLAVAGRS